jgi:hypothetical protein
MGRLQRLLVALLCVGLCACMLKYERVDRDAWGDDVSDDMDDDATGARCEPLFEEVMIGFSDPRPELGNLIRAGEAWAVVWTTEDTSSLVTLTTVGSTGEFVQMGIDVTDTPGNYADPVVAWSGSGYGVAWTEIGVGVGFSIVGDGGEAETDVLLTSPSDNCYVDDLIRAGARYAVAWECQGTSFDRMEFYVAVVTDTGAIFGTPVLIDEAVSDRTIYDPQLAWSGTVIGVLWGARETAAPTDSLHMTRISPDGMELGSARLVVTLGYETRGHTFLWNGSEFAVLYSENADPVIHTWLRTISAEGVPSSSSIELSLAGAYEHPHSLVVAGWDYAIIWNDTLASAWFDLMTVEGHLTGEAYELPISTALWEMSLAWASGPFGLAYLGNVGEDEGLYIMSFECD